MSTNRYWQHGSSKRGHLAPARDLGAKRSGHPLYNPKKAKTSTWQKRRHGDRRSLADLLPWRYVVGAALLAAFGYGAWYLAWSDAFAIDEVVIEAKTEEVRSEITAAVSAQRERRAMLVFPQNNTLFFSVRAAEDAIAERVYVGELSVRRQLPGTVTVTVVEVPPAAVLAYENGFYAVDEAGLVVRRLTEGEVIRLRDLPPEVGMADARELGAEVVDLSAVIAEPEGTAGTPDAAVSAVPDNSLPWPLVLLDDRGVVKDGILKPGSKILPPEAVLTVLDAEAELGSATGERPRWYTVRPAAETVDVTMTSGWQVYLSTAAPLRAQSENLKAILKEKVGERLGELQYVDLRYNERVFYRFREAEEGRVPEAPAIEEEQGQ
jgi:cell division septal protein FtsQ